MVTRIVRREDLIAALAWGLGAAAGTAIGAYLTAVGGEGAPGIEQIEAASDLLVMPAAAFGIVFVGYLGAMAIVRVARGSSSEQRADGQNEDEKPEGDGIVG
jgi:hypothetical protein